MFGQVAQILVPCDFKFLLVRKYFTTRYSQHYHAYHVEKTPDFSVVNITDLAIHEVFHVYKLLSCEYVTVRSCNHVDLFYLNIVIHVLFLLFDCFEVLRVDYPKFEFYGVYLIMF